MICIIPSSTMNLLATSSGDFACQLKGRDVVTYTWRRGSPSTHKIWSSSQVTNLECAIRISIDLLLKFTERRVGT